MEQYKLPMSNGIQVKVR